MVTRRLYIGNKVIGEIEGEVFKKRIQGSKHILRKPPAIAIDKDTIDRVRYEIESIEVTDIETGVIYRTTVDAFLEKAIRIDRQHGVQLALLLNSWAVELPGQERLF